MNIKGNNILIREMQESDVTSLFEAVECPEVSSMYSNGFDSIKKVKSYIDLIISEYQKGIHKTFAVADINTNKMIGSITVDVCEPFKRAEYGYWINKDFRNRGYATETVKTMNEYCFKALGINRIQAFTSNPKSERVLMKSGMIYEGTLRQYFGLDGHYWDAKMYAILAEDFKK